MKLVEYWIRIPKWVKQGILIVFVIYFLVIWFNEGLKEVIHLLKHHKFIFSHMSGFQLILCFVMTTLLFILLKMKNHTNKKDKQM